MNLTKERLADLIGLSTRRIDQLAREGVAVRVGPGLFDGPQSVRNYMAKMSQRAEQAGTKLDLNNERAKLAKAQRIGLEIRNAATRASLLPADEVDREWAAMCAKITATMMAVPDRVWCRLDGFSLRDSEILADEIREALSGLRASTIQTLIQDAPADVPGAE